MPDLSRQSATPTAHFITDRSEATLANEIVLGTGVIMAGAVGARPAFGTAGRLYFATDVNGGELQRDSGAAWVKVAEDETHVSSHALGGADSLSEFIDRIVATTTVVNTNVETDLYRKTILANTLGANGGMRFTAWGDALNNAGGAQSQRFRLKLGATTLFDSGVIAIGVAATRGWWRISGFIVNANATNAQRAYCWIDQSGLGGVFQAPTVFMHGYTTSAIDTTANADLALTVQLSGINAALDTRLHVAWLESMTP